MKRIGKKATALALCASLMSFYPALYAEAEETQTEQTGEWKPVRLTVSEPSEPKVTKIPDGHAYIPKDTPLTVALLTEITSKKAKVGDDVPLVTVENIIINDVVVIPKGTRVNAKVTKATSSGLFGRAGKLEFAVESVNSLNGVKVPLTYTTIREEESDAGAVAVFAAVSMLGGLFMKGKNVIFPAGQQFQLKVPIDTDLNVPLDRLAEDMNPDKPHGVSITIK